MAIVGVIDGGDNTVTVTPGGNYSADGLGGVDTLVVDFSTLGINVEYRNAGYGWYSFTDDFFNSITFINFERFMLTGGGGDDTLVGANLDDQLSGGAGNDILHSGLGADVIDGGIGVFDRWVASYGSVIGNVTVTLLATGPALVGGTNATVSRIEQLTMTTGIGADVIDTLAVTGSDTVSTGAGDDIFRTAGGFDSFDGGTDIDRMVIDYSDSTTAIGYTNEGYGWWRLGDKAGTQSVSYINVDSFDLTGGSGRDRLSGGNLDDRLVGNGGNDYLNGADGVDTIDGGNGTDTWQVNYYAHTETASVNLMTQTTNTGAVISGIEAIHYTGSDVEDTVIANDGIYNDWFYTNGGDDEITSGRGRDIVDGGTGFDTLHMDWSGISDALQGISTTNQGYGWWRYSSLSGDQLDFINIDQYDLRGGAGGDNLLGGANYDWLRGNDGDDTLNSSTGDALIDGGAGNDRWSANLASENIAVRVNLVGSQTEAQAKLAGLNVRNIEMLSLTTGTGADNINAAGYAFNDTISTGDGDDIVNSGLGRDTVDGGVAIDKLVLDWSSITSPMVNVYNSDQGYGWWRFGTSDTQNHVDYINFEQFDLTGGAGADALNGGALYDWLRGGDGDDTLNSAAGDALIDGGAGADRWAANLSAETKAVKFNATLSQTTSQATLAGLDVRNIESLTITTGAAADVISTAGFALDDWISTGASNDSIATGLGRDTVDGGTGTGDRLVLDYSSLTTDIARSDQGYGWMRYADAAGTTYADYINIERFDIQGGSGHDELIGGSIDDVLRGGAGDDILNGYRGIDEIVGGLGNDTWVADYANAAGALSLTTTALGAGTLTGIGTTLLTVENIHLVTGEFHDVVNLGAGTGNDRVYTNGGDDIINVGRGRADLADGGIGIDTLIADASLTAGSLYLTNMGYGWWRYTTNSGDYRLDFINIDSLNFTGGVKGDKLAGFGGADVLNGAGGADRLEGGGGNDILTGGAGADQFYFSGLTTVGVDRITDATAGDFIRLAGLTLNGAVGSGTGGTLLTGGVEVSTSGGISTLYVGLDATAGADLQVQLDGTFVAGNFSLSGSDIFII